MSNFKKLCSLIWILALVGYVQCVQVLNEDFQAVCLHRCPFQKKTENHFDVGCGSECKIGQCSKGCLLWRKALESNCQTVCNGTENLLSQKELHCIMGCNDAINQYFQKLKDEIGTPPAPYLVADTLTATSLSLAWEGARYSEISYLVQWRYEEHAGAWQYCRNQSWGPSSVVLVENLQPYTKYRFRVALLLSPHSEPIVSEPSVVISTLAAGIPSSPPSIIRATAVDPKRISVSWKPGPFPNGPVHSYVLELLGEYVALKEDIPATKTTDFYMFQNLSPDSKYIVSISMRNAAGEGPSATAEVLTPPEPAVKDTPQPILILGSKHTVIKQGADMMLDAPAVIYETSRLITGVGIHVNKNLLFVSDAEGFVSVTTLKEFSEPNYLLTPYDVTFKPLDLSVDWLNQHLYVLGEVTHNQAHLWQVARCSLEGKGLTVAVAGLTVKPLHIEVDPYNGYLFWLIQGHNRGGLYRLDLANISNGIKHEVIPDVIFEDPNLGAFVVDHINFCILVPNHAKNTVYSVSLDGREVADLRSNTQQPLFQNVLSLAIANGLFYWTNGDEVLAEDYHEEYHTYFHNHYLGSRNRSYLSVHVDLSTSQPIPVPVNPPIHVQAVLGNHVAKVSWHTPHVVGGQGKGAWQNWSYELQIKNEKTGVAKTLWEIMNATSYTVEGLEDDTEYLIKAAAYTSSGSGPWSTEFRGKTIKTPAKGRLPSLLWSAAEGLLESDVTGDELEILLSQENLKDGAGEYHFVDMTWYHEMLYLVSNTSKIYWYNTTSHDYGQFSNIESVGSIAMDWIGKKLYWSNPKQQLIIRGNLSGLSPEPLLILTIAKELNIDSEHAFIYWSTGHAVECARLNGDGRRVYYPAELFSGKQVMGLTLNMDDRHVYWIVRSNEGSTLYRASMAHSSGVIKKDEEPIKICNLKHPSMQGPLRYFDNHLLWLQDNKNAIIGDLFGQNVAVVSGLSLSGLNTVDVLDRNSRTKSDEKEIRVIPDPIDESSIRVVGTSSSFNITWNPVLNVNFGRVFYEIKTEDCSKENLAKLVKNEMTYDRARELLPYSEIKVTLQAFTYWGSSPRVMKVIHSPPSTPGAPTNPRVFVTSHVNATTADSETDALVRWDPPADPNGIITAYKLEYYYHSEDVHELSQIYLQSDELEWTLRNLSKNFTYVFQIQAFTVAGGGEFTKPVEANSSFEKPLPTLLVTTKDSIKLMDCDREVHKTLFSGDQPTDVTLNSHEGWIYWLNEMQEILKMKLDGTSKTKIHLLNGTGLSLTIDWVGRFLYWSELEGKGPEAVCSIKRLDLSQTENGVLHVEVILKRNGRVEELEVSPFTGRLYWIEVNNYEGRHLMQSRTNGNALRPLLLSNKEHFHRKCTCPENPRIGKILTVDQTDPYNIVIIYSDEWQSHIYKTEPRGCDCTMMIRFSALSPTSITTDHRFLYWLNETEDSVFILKQDSKVQAFAMEGVKKITAVGTHLQPFPPFKCLTINEYTHAPKLFESTATSITLDLDQPDRSSSCENVSLPSVQYVIYYDAIDEFGVSKCIEDFASCKTILSFRSLVKLEGLKPFSKYVFMASVRNYFKNNGDDSGLGPPVVFATLPGAPPPPQNLTVIVLTPNILEVNWISSKKFPFNTIWYQVHWRTEGVVSGIRQSGEQILEGSDSDGSVFHRVVVRKLMPGQIYLIWVRAYSKLSSAYSESEKIEVKTYCQPENITLVRATPYSLEIAWTPPKNVYNRFGIQFRRPSSSETWKNVSLPLRNNNHHLIHHYLVKNLSPKSFYRFRFVIAYKESKQPYVWPQDGFEFETLGDRPSRPGTPIIQQLRKDVYQVLWEKSRDNGAAIDYYALEGLVRKIWRRKRETYYNGSLGNLNKPMSEQWTLYYNGTENYWIINELSPSLKYVFRVKAKNQFGWSDFSETSKSFDFTEAAMLASQEELSVVLATTVPLLFLCCLVVLAIFCCVTKMRDKEKKDLQILTLTTASRGPDVELATLRELPRRGNFIHNANILYATSGPPVDEEFSLLPHIRRDQFKLTKFLGSGAFGEVYEGVAQGLAAGMTDIRVAIKALRKGATDHEKNEFLKEALLMSHFKHEHILQLLGVCLDNDPNYILMELMEGGDLLSYLRTNRPLINTINGLTLQDLLEMCLDVTKGCRYLEEMHFVHRDLACRNCLVSSTDRRTRIVKIGDFGLARDVYKNDYYRKEGEGLLPVRWMAPESLVDGVFTSQSDVWAFGVLIWEIMTLGQQPYPARTNLEVLHYVRSGGRLGKPTNCSDELHQLMMKCWSFNSESRPNFKYCLEVLKDLKERTENTTLSTELGENYYSGTSMLSEENSENSIGSYNTELHDNENNSGSKREFETSESDTGTSELDTRSRMVVLKEPHLYLELIRGDCMQESDGYEIPRFVDNNLTVQSRTFSGSCVKSELGAVNQNSGSPSTGDRDLVHCSLEKLFLSETASNPRSNALMSNSETKVHENNASLTSNVVS